MIFDNVSAVEARIARELATHSECFVNQPAEMRVLEQMSETELQDFAHDRGWRVNRRVGGHRIQFYNDTNERLRNIERSR